MPWIALTSLAAISIFMLGQSGRATRSATLYKSPKIPLVPPEAFHSLVNSNVISCGDHLRANHSRIALHHPMTASCEYPDAGTSP